MVHLPGRRLSFKTFYYMNIFHRELTSRLPFQVYSVPIPPRLSLYSSTSAINLSLHKPPPLCDKLNEIVTVSNISASSTCESKLPKVNGKRDRDLFSTKDDREPNLWICSCGKRRRQRGTSYSNLISNARHCQRKELENAKEIDTISSASPELVYATLWKKSNFKVHG